MNYSALLQQLTAQVDLLADNLQPIVSHRCLYPRFSTGLFSANARYLGDYVAEVRNTLHQLCQAVARQAEKTDAVSNTDAVSKTDMAAWLAQRLLAQMQALHSEAASWQLRHNDFRQHFAGRWYRQLLASQQQRQRLLILAAEAAADHTPSAQDERAYLQRMLEKNQSAMQQIWQKLQQQQRVSAARARRE